MSIIEQLEAAGEVLSPGVRAATQGLEATVVLLPALRQARARAPAGGHAGTVGNKYSVAGLHPTDYTP